MFPQRELNQIMSTVQIAQAFTYMAVQGSQVITGISKMASPGVG